MFSIPLFITLVYGILYSVMSPNEFGFKRPIDPFYFSFTTMASVGYGDFTPKTDRAKLVVMTQHAIMVIGVATIIKNFITVK